MVEASLAERSMIVLVAASLLLVAFAGTASASHWSCDGFADVHCVHIHCIDPFCMEKQRYHCAPYTNGPLSGHSYGPCHHL